jgi:dihydrophenazinedicarboxylate synthase
MNRVAEPIETLSGDATLQLPEFDQPPAEPLPLLERWLRLADERGVREPRALALEDPDALRQAADSLAADEPVRRPARWGGWRLDPDLVEFWHGSPDRLHRRLLYIKGERGWQHRRPQP